MPFYESGKIVLNRNESECFRKQLKAPDPVAATRRDAFLQEIDRMLSIEETEEGVILSPVVPEKSVFTDIYSPCSRECSLPYRGIARLKPIEYFPLHSERWSGKRDFYSEQCPATLSYHEAEFQDCA